MSSAYLLLHRKNPETNKIEVLIGQKQVINFKAIDRFLKSEKKKNETWTTLGETFSSKKPLICKQGKVLDKDGNHIDLGKYLDSMLLAAGGKACFLGGKINENEPIKKAAIREFAEEIDLSEAVNKMLPKKSLEEVWTEKDGAWTGHYYCLDFDKLQKKLKSDLLAAIDRYSKNIAENEKKIASSLLNDRTCIFDIQLERYEMHKIEWCSLSTLKDKLAEFDQEFIKDQLTLLINFLFPEPKNEDIRKSLTDFHVKVLADYIKNENTQGNTNAAVALVDRLLKQDLKDALPNPQQDLAQATKQNPVPSEENQELTAIQPQETSISCLNQHPAPLPDVQNEVESSEESPQLANQNTTAQVVDNSNLDLELLMLGVIAAAEVPIALLNAPKRHRSCNIL